MNIGRVFIMTLLCLAAAVVAGCGGSRYDSRLLAADSLVNARPDSALTLLSGIAPGEMAGSADRAYFSLLITQAKYKCDRAIKSTDTIDVAIAHFAGNHDREKYTRSLIYKGAVLDELGDKTEAMLWYKRAEENADTDDCFNLGYVNMRMAGIYKNTSSRGREYIDKQKLALHYFTLANDQHYKLVNMSYLGAFYRLTDIDSALIYATKSIELARQLDDSTQLYFNYEILSSIYGEKSMFYDEKECALYAIRTGRRYISNKSFFYISQAYAKLGMPDSADYYLNMLPPEDTDIYEHTSRLMTLTQIALSKDDYKAAYRYNDLDNRISDSLLNLDICTRISQTERDFDKEKAEFERQIEKRDRIIIYIILSVIVLILMVVIALLRIQMKKRILILDVMLSELRNDYKKAQLMIESSEFKTNSLRKTMDMQIEKMQQVFRLSENMDMHKPAFVQRKIREILAPENNDNDRKQLIDTVNSLYGNILDELHEKYDFLNDNDMKLLALTLCGFSNSYISFCMGFANKQYVINCRNRIAKRMGIGCSLTDYLKSLQKS